MSRSEEPVNKTSTAETAESAEKDIAKILGVLCGKTAHLAESRDKQGRAANAAKAQAPGVGPRRKVKKERHQWLK